MSWNWLSIRGRIPRSTYWVQYVLPLGAVMILVPNFFPSLGTLWLVVWGLGFLLWIPGGVKRLHDHGGPAWLLLIAFPGSVLLMRTVSGMGGSVRVMGDEVSAGFYWALGTVSMAWVALGAFLALAAGKRGPNRYGPDPLEPEDPGPT